MLAFFVMLFSIILTAEGRRIGWQAFPKVSEWIDLPNRPLESPASDAISGDFKLERARIIRWDPFSLGLRIHVFAFNKSGTFTEFVNNCVVSVLNMQTSSGMDSEDCILYCYSNGLTLHMSELNTIFVISLFDLINISMLLFVVAVCLLSYFNFRDLYV